MPNPAPGADENATALYGIRWPKPSRKAYKLSESLQRLGEDVEGALGIFGLPPVVTGTPRVAASAAARDASWGVPANAAARRALQDLGAMTVRTDLGKVEQYFANLTDGGANPGGRVVAGWYPPLVSGWNPLVPGSVVPSAGASTLSPVGAFTFTNAPSVQLRNSFDRGFRIVKIHLEIDSKSAAEYIDWIMLDGSNADSGTAIANQMFYGSASAAAAGAVGGQVGAAPSARYKAELEFTNANLAAYTDVEGHGTDAVNAGTPLTWSMSGVHLVATAFPSIRFKSRSGATLTGKGFCTGYFEG